jgi:hypothetical protein
VGLGTHAILSLLIGALGVLSLGVAVFIAADPGIP